jgi:hypothetical protein
MDKQALHERLEQLHRDLQALDIPEARDRRMLDQLAADIRELLDRRDQRPQHYRRLSERLAAGIAQIEASHPRITILMRQVIDQLAYMGI